MRLTVITAALLLTATSGYGAEIAPDWRLASGDGGSVRLSQEIKNQPVILFFWATWCPYCKALMPHLQSMQIEYGDDIRIFAFNIRDDEDPWLFMEDKGYDFTLIPEADSIMPLYKVQGVPAVILVDGSGSIRFNLYDMIFTDSDEYKAMSHGKKAGYRAPNWAAEIRNTIDQVLAEGQTD